MLNHIVVMGRLTRDPEIRYTQSQIPVASFTVAVDRDFSGKDGGEKQTDFINCVAWRSTAEFLQKYFHKGSMAVISGRLQIRQYDDKDGNRRTAAEIVADNVYFGDSKKDSGSQQSGSYQAAAPQSSYQPAPARGIDVPAPSYHQQSFTESDADDGELPF